VKIIGLAKRKEGMPLEEFRGYSLETHAAKDLKLPGLRRYYQSTSATEPTRSAKLSWIPPASCGSTMSKPLRQ